MLGLSLNKILLIVLVAFLVWRGLRVYQQVQARLAAVERGQAAAPRPAAAARAAPARGATDLVACPRCGAFVPNGTICRSVEECRFRKAT